MGRRVGISAVYLSDIERNLRRVKMKGTGGGYWTMLGEAEGMINGMTVEGLERPSETQGVYRCQAARLRALGAGRHRGRAESGLQRDYRGALP